MIYYYVQDIRSGEIVYITHLYSQACKVLHRQRARAHFRIIESVFDLMAFDDVKLTLELEEYLEHSVVW